jgi:hypothetical protein
VVRQPNPRRWGGQTLGGEVVRPRKWEATERWARWWGRRNERRGRGDEAAQMRGGAKFLKNFLSFESERENPTALKRNASLCVG